MTSNTHGREVEYLARDRLQSQGYQVVRSAGSHSPVDLVAWQRSGHLVFIKVKRTRALLTHPTQVARLYRDDIAALRSIDRPRFAVVQLWLWTGRRGWRIFDVMSGGICEVTDHVA